MPNLHYGFFLKELFHLPEMLSGRATSNKRKTMVYPPATGSTRKAVGYGLQTTGGHFRILSCSLRPAVGSQFFM